MTASASGPSHSAPDSLAAAKQLRVLLVARRFWPLTDDSAGRLSTLAEGLRRAGMAPTVLTARFANHWPAEFSFREVQVLRPFAAPRHDWTNGIYQRSLHRWLRENASHFDVLYADAMRDEGAAVVEIAETMGLPSVVRCGGCDGGDWLHASTSRHARKSFNVAGRAQALVAASASAARALVSSGVDRNRVQRIADGIPPAVRREKSDCLTARAALASINSDLRVPSQGRVITVCGRFEADGELMMVAQSLAPLCETENHIRLWFIGDGSQRELLHHFLQDRGIRTSTALPGSFWHIDELIRASDLMLFPSDRDSMEQRLPQAISGGVPIAIVDTPETRSFFSELRETKMAVEMFPVNKPESLRELVVSMLSNYEQYCQRAIALRNTLRRIQPREQSIDTHHRLFLRLVQRKVNSESTTAMRKLPRAAGDKEAMS